MSAVTISPVGFTLSNGSSIVHGAGMNKKVVFSDLGFPVTMNELWPGTDRESEKAVSFGGQLGLIDFDTSIRLPRHVHIWGQQFTHERILVLQGVALVEMNGEIYVIPPRTLVTIAPGVPHTWTACPAGVCIEDVVEKSGKAVDSSTKTVSTGTFLMVYEYEEPTSFRPTRQIETLNSVDEYVACEIEGLNEIRIPELDAATVTRTCCFVHDKDAIKPNTS